MVDNEYMNDTNQLAELHALYAELTERFEAFTDYCQERTDVGDELNKIWNQICKLEG